jgi:hypothetical protein
MGAAAWRILMLPIPKAFGKEYRFCLLTKIAISLLRPNERNAVKRMRKLTQIIIKSPI